MGVGAARAEGYWRGLAVSLAFMAAALIGCAEHPTEVDTRPGYRERHRPQLHFSPPAMWMNDPNGLVYHAGEYHLYYQFYPNDRVWGPMHWGHAVSRDLFHWEHLPIALAPDQHGYIFSGSAVVDHHNSSGFGTDGEPPMVAIYTYHDPERARLQTGDHESQAIAYSNDRGRSFRRYAGNPVLPNPGGKPDFRDPKVFWYEPGQQWVMALSVHDRVQFWASNNLRNWRFLSEFGQNWGGHDGTWECPDLFPIRVEGSDQLKWVLLLNLNPGGPQGGSGTQYFVGDFNGHEFTLEPRFADTLRQQPAVWLDWGRDNYAGVTWSDAPLPDHQRLFIGWMSNWDYAQQVPTEPWRSAMTLPRVLSLTEQPQGYRIRGLPAPQLDQLRGASKALPAMRLSNTRMLSEFDGLPIATSELTIEAQPQADTVFGLELSNALGERYRLGFDSASNTYFSDRSEAGDHTFSDQFARVHRAPREQHGGPIRLRLVLDVASVELFADDGLTVLTDTFFPSQPFDRITLYSEGGATELSEISLTGLRRVW